MVQSTSDLQHLLEVLQFLFDSSLALVQVGGLLVDEGVELLEFVLGLELVGLYDGDPVDLHVLVGQVVLGGDLVLQPRVVGLGFPVEIVHVEDVVPEEVRPVYVGVEGQLLLLKSGPLHVADVAEVFFVLLQGPIFLPQASEGVQHYTRDDIGEHSPEEDAVYCVVGKAGDFESLHGLADGPRYIELEDAVEHGLATILLGLVATEDVFHVVTESDGAEDEGEEHSHETDVDQL